MARFSNILKIDIINPHLYNEPKHKMSKIIITAIAILAIAVVMTMTGRGEDNLYAAFCKGTSYQQ